MISCQVAATQAHSCGAAAVRAQTVQQHQLQQVLQCSSSSITVHHSPAQSSTATVVAAVPAQRQQLLQHSPTQQQQLWHSLHSTAGSSSSGTVLHKSSSSHTVLHRSIQHVKLQNPPAQKQQLPHSCVKQLQLSSAVRQCCAARLAHPAQWQQLQRSPAKQQEQLQHIPTKQ